MKRGMTLQSDFALFTAIDQKQNVEVRVNGLLEYEGQLRGYNEDVIVVDDGFRFFRQNVIIKTA